MGQKSSDTTSIGRTAIHRRGWQLQHMPITKAMLTNTDMTILSMTLASTMLN